jgi:hypothetical protein
MEQNMKKLIFTLLILLLPSIVMSATLDPPWKRFYKSGANEHWYDSSRVTKTHTNIDVFTWEVNPESATYRHVSFDIATKERLIGLVKAYKYGNLVYHNNMSQAGYIKPDHIDRKLFNIVNKYK